MKVIVNEDSLYPNPTDPSFTVAVGSQAWFRWLAQHDRFIYQCGDDRFTARREELRSGNYWYGYRNRAPHCAYPFNGRNDRVYLSPNYAP